MTMAVQAVYRNEPVEEFRGNPLIEALPEPFEPADAIMKLMVRPPYDPADRLRPAGVRQMLTQRLARLHQPVEREVDVLSRIDRCIRWGYAGRSPVFPSYTQQLCRGYDVCVSDGSINYSGGYHPHTYGFALLGVSGIGKTTAVESILSLYPQVISHSSYHGHPLVMKQVVWLKLDCACDGSLKGLCMEFFHQLDELLGTSYLVQTQHRRHTLDQSMIRMSRLCVAHNIGVLIIDEIQHLCSAKADASEKVLNFLVTLVNTIGVPVIMIGTPKALALLQKDFQQAKRGSGQGDALWERLEAGPQWHLLCEAMWTYQYTRQEVPFSQKFEDVLYSEAQGIPFLAVHLYKLVQEEAILSGKETFLPEDFHRAASEKMGLTRPMREAMKAGKEVPLQQFADINPFSLSDYQDNYSVSARDVPPAPDTCRKVSVQEEASVTLMGLGLTYQEASSFVCMALADDKNGCLSAPETARKAYAIYLSSAAVTNDTGSQPSHPFMNSTGYDALMQKGLIENEKHI